jgi:hypothetical protein
VSESTATVDAGHAHGHGHGDDEPKTYGILAEFATGDELAAATRKAYADGYRRMDTYSPYPVADACDALGFPKSEMATIMMIGGFTGAFAGFFMEYWCNTYGYTLNIGGRPWFSWPSFIPICFEMMVLTTALSGLFGLISLCGLPRLNHPLFAIPEFDRATKDRFFLCIEAEDPRFDVHRTKEFANSLGAVSVQEVPE